MKRLTPTQTNGLPLQRFRPPWTAEVRLENKRPVWVAIAGMVICRQRPGTASGHCFVRLEDETGIANAFVPNKLFESHRLVMTQENFLKIHGELQRREGVVTILAKRVIALR